MVEINKSHSDMDMRDLKKKTIIKFSFLIILLSLLFFSTAGTILYWEAWLYLASFVIQMVFIIRFLIKNDPELLKRRVEQKETRSEQKLIVGISSLFIISIYIIPGFDKRFGWSIINPIAVCVADIIFLLGYRLFFIVLKVNSYASRTVKVEKEKQEVITTGPYSKVRHPMYLAFLIMFGSTAIALGSYIALIPYIMLFILILFRINSEEKLLVQELEGYRTYMEKTKKRLLPGIW